MNSGHTLPLNGSSVDFLETLYARFCEDPRSVSPDWRRYFEALATDDAAVHANGLTPNGDALLSEGGNRFGVPQIGPSFPTPSLFRGAVGESPAASFPRDAATSRMLQLQDKVDQLIRSFRIRGHKAAQLNPLDPSVPHVPQLDPEYYGFTPAELDLRFSTTSLGGYANDLSLRELLEHLRETYCRRIGVQFMHLDDYEIRNWLMERMESCRNRTQLTRSQQVRILMRLTEAVVFEEFIPKRFTGAKSFSLEGAESLIPLLEMAIEHSGDQGVNEIVLGMAHRGRLNVLANIMGKAYHSIFREFRDIDTEYNIGRGDVKYHLGYSSDWKCASGKNVHLSLCFNPSHLEYVNPVALGRVRAKQDRAKDWERKSKMAILIHGDAAFAGEGIVQETLNLSQLEGYRTGGCLHVIVNNQIGFTTPTHQARSTHYATDVAKMLDAPIFHVNGEDPEAVAHVVTIALDYRHKFHSDVFIDMYCYRRHGHNETDEPEFTQPEMYRLIRQRPSIRNSYLKHLLESGGLSEEEANYLADERQQQLEKALEEAVKDDFRPKSDAFRGYWQGYVGGWESNSPDVDTGIPAEKAKSLLRKLCETPTDFQPHKKIERFNQLRMEMCDGARPLDWGAGEALALASLSLEGKPIRISGQDCERGTFSHRHLVLHDYRDGRTYAPIQNLAPNQAQFEVVNSPLSEAGVMGFDYGYCLDRPDGLVIWEAQFGDFSNVAQVIIDQFLVSAEDKWRRLTGLTLLLPHGFEGQGPEHSSARLERFLQGAAEDNVQIVQPTTPAQIFHLLRRQVLRKWRKPLIVMTPKQLLRHPQAVSGLEEIISGAFRRILPDGQSISPSEIQRILICSGKVYYELAERRAKLGREDVAIIRMEQLYPLPNTELRAALSNFKSGTPAYWVQDEPENMGAWRFIRVKYGEKIFDQFPLGRISRPESSSPATGSHSSHKLEQERILDEAFGLAPMS